MDILKFDIDISKGTKLYIDGSSYFDYDVPIDDYGNYNIPIKGKIDYGCDIAVKKDYEIEINSISNLYREKFMNTESGITLTGHINFKLYDSLGNLKQEQDVNNTVTTPGLYGIIDQILASPTGTGYTGAKIGWCELGTGSSLTSNKLQTYISGSRTVFDSKSRNNAVVTTVTTFPAGTGTGAITEAGLFDVATQNTAYAWCYATFAAVNKAAGDSLVVTWTITAA